MSTNNLFILLQDTLQKDYTADEHTIIILSATLLIVVVFFSPVTYLVFNKSYKFLKKAFTVRTTEEEKISIIQEIQTSVDTLCSLEKGATIIIDVQNETNDYVIDSELIDSRVTSNLITNIFEGSKTPLHDGAIIIKDNRIDRASAYITKLSEQPVPKKFGTRHRSALGLSEVTKAIIIVVSEETSKIRIFHNSKWEDVAQRDVFNRIVDLWI
ncbi:MAG: hypothetical protein TYPL_0680 [Candidatus Tyloplasma litorale]|nr:MAG: hypothetical protein TYPL_0680 [Mycoplasmatales bacterium]